jgi:hypothetical protein
MYAVATMYRIGRDNRVGPSCVVPALVQIASATLNEA